MVTVVVVVLMVVDQFVSGLVVVEFVLANVSHVAPFCALYCIVYCPYKFSPPWFVGHIGPPRVVLSHTWHYSTTGLVKKKSWSRNPEERTSLVINPGCRNCRDLSRCSDCVSSLMCASCFTLKHLNRTKNN